MPPLWCVPTPPHLLTTTLPTHKKMTTTLYPLSSISGLTPGETSTQIGTKGKKRGAAERTRQAVSPSATHLSISVIPISSQPRFMIRFIFITIRTSTERVRGCKNVISEVTFDGGGRGSFSSGGGFGREFDLMTPSKNGRVER